MQPVVIVPIDELRAVVTEALAEALDAREGRPTLLDRAGLAKALSCSASQVDALRKRGLPTRTVGKAPRFDLPEVLGWLKAGAP